MKTGYLNLKYKPKYQSEIIAIFYVESKLRLEKIAVEIAKESSIGSWTELTTSSQKIFDRLAPQIFYLNKKSKIIKIAYPLALFEPGNIPQLLSSLAGNIFSMKIVKNLRLLDIEFPQKYINSFAGPRWGIEGVRNILNIKKRPLIGSIIKPKVGLTAKQHAKLAYNVWRNGVDIVKDDENLTDLSFNKFNDRVSQVLKLRKKAEQETKLKKMHVFNITGPADVMLQRAKYVKKQGGRCVMIDLVACGLDNVQYLRKQNLGLIIHGHRAGHAMFTRNPKHGMTMLVLAKLSRLAGIDQLHTGTIVGKMEGDSEEVISINRFLKEDWRHFNFLRSDWSGIKPVMPIASGGLHPGLVPKLVKHLGQNLIINFGAGLHGHPDGSMAGAVACYAAVEAVHKNKNLVKYFKLYPELKVALKHWKQK
ncbi:type III ribulose-bisphosphate carboxylase [Patescibacteria group bacterium]|nr:type III ribulose-bisphosphate carboxylase [Patescibacteria group bacterium]